MQNLVFNIVVIVIMLLGLAGVIYFVYRQQSGTKARSAPRGRAFQAEKTAGAMQAFARKNAFRYIAPASIKRGDEVAHMDALVIGYFGVLGVISLGYSGEIYGEPGEETWVQVAEDGVRTRFANPIDECSAAVRAVRDALFAGKMKRVPVEVVYVFNNPKAQVALPRSVEYLNMKSFKNMLEKDKYLEDCGLDMDAVEQALRQALADK